jgi:hypothetical protein
MMDVDAFRNIFLTGQRATWEIAISPFTYSEIIHTRHLQKLHDLTNWFEDVWSYWFNILQEDNNLPSPLVAEKLQREIFSSRVLDVFPDPADRKLLCDAIIYRCDFFCTRDWKTILKYRDRLHSSPINIISPKEWWNRISPYASLWA